MQSREWEPRPLTANRQLGLSERTKNPSVRKDKCPSENGWRTEKRFTVERTVMQGTRGHDRSRWCCRKITMELKLPAASGIVAPVVAQCGMTHVLR
ncbi:hypothetical protein TREES_T100020517 [Tupaia chinensis]|uniref:Uncharacterized protein n=1 Tax=Tupaia chinensis TaxID=246437 RepID=L9KWS8_TUPCH|nr:hypothetical protein TREES_T100020517 [Tupaia chinensis]